MVLSDAISRVVWKGGLAGWPVLNPSSQLLTVISWTYAHLPAQQGFDRWSVGWSSFFSACKLRPHDHLPYHCFVVVVTVHYVQGYIKHRSRWTGTALVSCLCPRISPMWSHWCPIFCDSPQTVDVGKYEHITPLQISDYRHDSHIVCHSVLHLGTELHKQFTEQVVFMYMSPGNVYVFYLNYLPSGCDVAALFSINWF